MTKYGGVASGHKDTSEAAMTILQNGGNAFDAALAAFCAACVCEPVLASLGGGGFLLAKPANATSHIYDFFVQTPKQKNSSVEFKEIQADFGNTVQHFHIGMGSVATPGAIAGIFHIHNQLGHMPLKDIFQPAINLAKNGIEINPFQAYVFNVIKPILSHHPSSLHYYASKKDAKKLIQAGEKFYLDEFADFLDCLAKEGQDLFYRGEVAKSIIQMNQEGGHLGLADLKDYHSIARQPLRVNRGPATLYTNPGPSSGGLLIAFALQLLKEDKNKRDKSYFEKLINIMSATNQARQSIVENQSWNSPVLLDEFRKLVIQPWSTRGTTHISVIDKQQNLASLSLSNGEGCGLFVPHTGIMLNNMLGEEDLHPQGFNQWPCDTRMTSMLAPSLLTLGDRSIVIGSGGSNRLRTAILQVIINLIDFDMPLEAAISAPRIHFENQLLNIEPGFEEEILNHLLNAPFEVNCWQEQNLFFGGTHCVQTDKGEISAFGDKRRSGVGLVL